MDNSWLDLKPMRELIDDLAEKAVRDYRTEPDQAREIIRQSFANNNELRQTTACEKRPEYIARTRIFKKCAAAARKKIYYGLRRYRADDKKFNAAVSSLLSLPTKTTAARFRAARDAVLIGHASTRERLLYLSDFYAKLSPLIGKAKTILDVGCGSQPLAFPIDNTIRLYVAADSDAVVISVLQAWARKFAKKRVLPLRWDIADGWAPIQEATGVKTFDVALMLKLVPVVGRRKRRLLQTLHKTPARKIVITGCRVALAKNRSIERREKGMLRRFIAEAGFKPLAEFAIENEFGWLAERP